MSTTDNTPEDPQTLALRALTLKALQTRVAEAVAENKAALEAAMQPGDSKKPQFPGTRQRLGTVGYSAGAMRVTVTDMDKLAEWVMERYPTETLVTVTIREAFLKKIVDMSKTAEQPCGPGGELDVPGLAVKPGDPFISVRPDKKVGDWTWSQLLAGQRSVLDEITGSEDDVVDAEIVEGDEGGDRA